MKEVTEKDRRNGNDRRRLKDRRQCDLPQYGGQERRLSVDRRLLEERRAMITADLHFSHR